MFGITISYDTVDTIDIVCSLRACLASGQSPQAVSTTTEG